jgi:predicted nucleic acid-binding protein
MSPGVLVLDASPMNHFARAGHLETLQKLIAAHEYECVTTRAVVAELQQGTDRHAEIGDAIGLDWIRVVPCDDLRELYLFAQYMKQLGNEERNAGEATVLAWAEAHGAAAYVDDQVACNVGRNRGVTVHRTLHLIVNAFRVDLMTEDAAVSLVRSLLDSDARFPAAVNENLFDWARSQHLL